MDKEQSERLAQALQEVEDIESGKLPRESAREMLNRVKERLIKETIEDNREALSKLDDEE
ncbi:hypothetical protein JOC34_000847 [Virgibacillus halotolerans]|uniref:hypothetical protein n=1 Tax=Virgibacillus halotolerans TaxID=1071053 RepID=UPI00196006CF|nr:hypothetical protein [Virgibacillus halotolerans]MBM7598490.1 hypothetical protein [Virgibacillus halotolerans]